MISSSHMVFLIQLLTRGLHKFRISQRGRLPKRLKTADIDHQS